MELPRYHSVTDGADALGSMSTVDFDRRAAILDTFRERVADWEVCRARAITAWADAGLCAPSLAADCARAEQTLTGARESAASVRQVTRVRQRKDLATRKRDEMAANANIRLRGQVRAAERARTHVGFFHQRSGGSAGPRKQATPIRPPPPVWGPDIQKRPQPPLAPRPVRQVSRRVHFGAHGATAPLPPCGAADAAPSPSSLSDLSSNLAPSPADSEPDDDYSGAAGGKAAVHASMGSVLLFGRSRNSSDPAVMHARLMQRPSTPTAAVAALAIAVAKRPPLSPPAATGVSEALNALASLAGPPDGYVLQHQRPAAADEDGDDGKISGRVAPLPQRQDFTNIFHTSGHSDGGSRSNTASTGSTSLSVTTPRTPADSRARPSTTDHSALELSSIPIAAQEVDDLSSAGSYLE